jgi:hypothetical protein
MRARELLTQSRELLKQRLNQRLHDVWGSSAVLSCRGLGNRLRTPFLTARTNGDSGSGSPRLVCRSGLGSISSCREFGKSVDWLLIWDEVRELLLGSYEEIAPKRLAERVKTET